MTAFFLSKLNMDTVVRAQVLVKSKSDFRYISVGHNSQAFGEGSARELVLLVESGERFRCGLESEANIDELLRVQVAMPVLSCADGRGESGSGSVDSLPDVFHVHSAGQLADELGSELLITDFLVHAQKVDFCHLDSLSVNNHSHWNS